MTSDVTLPMLLDPRGETEKAFRIAGRSVHQYLPKSQVRVKPHMEDGVHVKIRMREQKWLHPRASNAQRLAHRADPWKKNPDGTDFTYDAYGYDVTMPRWLAERSGYSHFAKKTFEGLMKAGAQLMKDEADVRQDHA
jgi:hypothetical protein